MGQLRVNVIEIRRGTQVLIFARPGLLPKAARAASDRQRLPGMLARLGTDKGAMAAVRAGWINVFPSVINVPAMSDAQIARYVTDALATKRAEAVLLRDARVPLSPAEVEQMQHAFANARVQRGQIIVAQAGHLPVQARAFANRDQAMALLAALQDGEEGSVLLDRQAGRLSGVGLGALRGRQLRSGIVAKLRSHVLDGAFIPPGAVADAAGAHPSAGGTVASMGPGDKVAAALQHSLPHLSGEVQALVAEMVTPANLAIMAGIFVAVALANTNPVTGAAVDSILLGLAWFSAGLTGVYALGDFIDATVSAIKAKNEAELDEAGKTYAKALVGMGSALIQAIMARFLTKKGGTTEEGAGGARGAKAKEPSKPTAEPPKKPAEPAPVPSMAAAKAALAKRGVPSETLATLSSHEEVGAFTETLNNVDAIDWTKLNQKSGNIFYSGMVGDQPAWKVAAEMAKTKNMNWITDVSGGALDKNRGLIPADAMDWLDTQLSKRLAQNVSGDVTFLGDLKTVATDRIFYKTELPELLKNVNVSPASKAKLLDIKSFLDAKAAGSPP